MSNKRHGLCRSCSYDDNNCNPGRVVAQGDMRNIKTCKKYKSLNKISFKSFVCIGKKVSSNIINGVPWSFEFNGCSVTHENDELYFISTEKGIILEFGISNFLVIRNGIICIYEEHK